MVILTQKDTDRFWSGVQRCSEDDCWPWKRYCNRDGYGTFKLNGVMVLAHRIVWVLIYDRIPDLFEGFPSEICHSCDNPPCCNPNHLFLGNQKINVKDCVGKGRHRNLGQKGEGNSRALVTEFQVKEIKQLLREGVLTHKEIAILYGVTKSAISLINIGRTWSYVML